MSKWVAIAHGLMLCKKLQKIEFTFVLTRQFAKPTILVAYKVREISQ